MTTREVYVLVPFDGHPKGAVFAVAYDTTAQRTRVNDLIHQGMLTMDATVLASKAKSDLPEQRGKP